MPSLEVQTCKDALEKIKLSIQIQNGSKQYKLKGTLNSNFLNLTKNREKFCL